MTAARLLDVSRLVSRAGRRPTGVDRVERAYLDYICNDIASPAFGIARTALGHVLLDRDGLMALAQKIDSGSWERPDLISRLNWRLSDEARQGQSFVRQIAHKRILRSHLNGTLTAMFADGFEYLNTGHSNLTGQMLQAVRTCPASVISILIHDTIPLDVPEYQRPGTPEAFDGKLRLASSYADRIICTSVACLRDVTRHTQAMGRTPPLIPAMLGSPVPVPEPAPPGVIPDGPYFVMVGTIEPRKNHAMILDVWDRLGADAPGLLICGTRGWSNKAVFDRLDRGVAGVTELAGLSDGAIATLLMGSKGLLFPSFAEGFGLPPVEAAALGVPVVCADLPACGEIMGNWPVYLNPNDSYQWENTVKRLAAETTPKGKAFDPPTWDSHFKLVFSGAS